MVFMMFTITMMFLMILMMITLIGNLSAGKSKGGL